MMTVSKRRWFYWPWIGIWMGIWGCTWFQPATEHEVPAADYAWGDLAMEVLPQHLSASLPESPPKPPEAPFFIHSVSQGETLIAIARWFTGEGRNWSIIARANPTLQPNGIRIGDRIKIPKELMITHKPLPRIKPAAKRRPPKNKSPDPKSIQVELFGPIVDTAATGEKDHAVSAAPIEPQLETID